MNKKDFPVQVVKVHRRDYRPPGTIRSTNKIFGDISPAIRKRLSKQVAGVSTTFSAQFAKWPDVPAVAKVTLKEEALAKSHRPVALLTKTTCPIVGTLDYGELLVSATEVGLRNLSARIRSTQGKKAIANITAIESIEPYQLNDWGARKSSRALKAWFAEGKELKFHLFDHKDEVKNRATRKALLRLAKELDIHLAEKQYGQQTAFFMASLAAEELSPEKALRSFIGLRSISPMPSFLPLDFNVKAHPSGTIDEDTLPPPESDIDYPVVGIIDSGICPECTLLKPWVVATEQYVPSELQDNVHGTMVAGLVVGAYLLNHEDDRFPRSQAKVIDVQVFEKNTPITEEALVSIIEEVVPKFPYAHVWNLSLGGECASDAGQFSDFATFLDEMHDVYGCLFTVAAGNHQHLQSWPHTKDFGGNDRVSSPGDSIRALTVGSIANAHKKKSLSKTEEPSPFSRRGPGPCHIPKPEVSHYGGNCSASMAYTQTGILSVGPSNALLESLGTSFATPLVSAQAAAIWKYLESDENGCTAERVKALVIHSALIGSSIVTKDTLHHTGFGRPGDVIDSLYCDPNSITFLIEADLRHGGYEFERWPIPIADDLKSADGKFRGEISMTLVYSPIVDKNFASEYCRTNVDVGMGRYDESITEDGELAYEFSSVVPLAPKDVKDLFEKNQIEHGFKWSPVKAYHAVFPRGKNVETWRLKMKATRRAELAVPERPQPATLLVTLRSHGQEGEVYNQSIRMINSAGWITTPIDAHIQVELEQR